jgi:hypothetical protein
MMTNTNKAAAVVALVQGLLLMVESTGDDYWALTLRTTKHTVDCDCRDCLKLIEVG